MVSCNQSSSHASNSCNVFFALGYEPVVRLEPFDKSNCSLEKLLVDAEYDDYTDAEIVVEQVSVGVHRCILALRSQFFHRLFKRGRYTVEGKQKYSISDLVPYGEIGYESFMVVLNYLYTGELKPSPPEVARCIDDSCAHDACAPAINHVVELMYLSFAFEMKELVEVVQHRLVNFLSKAFVEDVIPIIMVAFHCQLNQLYSQCVQRVVRADLCLLSLEKELTHEVWNDIKVARDNSLHGNDDDDGFCEDILKIKRIRRIYRALDCDDIELLKLLLEESDITLDDAYALHYAAAYCDQKVVKELLELNLADLNLRDPRGYTVLHIAARTKDPSVLVGLLNKGASASDRTGDGRTAVTMCRRMTCPKDYYEKSELREESSRDRQCIDLLETALHGCSSAVNMLKFPIIVPDDQLDSLELHEKRVDTGRCFSPNCSEVPDGFMEDDTQDILASKNCDREEERNKRMRMMQLKEEKLKAFGTDIAENSGAEPSFSSPSETDSMLLERARKLLRGNTGTRKMQQLGFDKAMMTFDIDKAGTNWTSFSTSSSCSISPSCGV